MIGTMTKRVMSGGLLVLASGFLMATTWSESVSILNGPTPVPSVSCAKVLETRKNKTDYWDEDAGEGKYIRHMLWSLKDYTSGPIEDGKWVGILTRVTADGETSPLLRRLKAGVSACVYFRYDGRSSEAWMHDSTMAVNSPLVRLEGAAFCRHPNDPDPGPEPVKDPGKCPEGSTLRATFTGPSDTVSVTIKPYRPKSAASDLRAAILKELKKQKHALLTDTQRVTFADTSVRAYIGETGPWFPCTQTDCCRVFNNPVPMS